jgi:dihydroxy-acid dehydratase
VSPEAAEGGNIDLIETGDTIVIDVPSRTVRFEASDEGIARRRAIQSAKGWGTALPRTRKVSAALKAYARLVTSADKGAVRNLALLSDSALTNI